MIEFGILWLLILMKFKVTNLKFFKIYLLNFYVKLVS